MVEGCTVVLELAFLDGEDIVLDINNVDGDTVVWDAVVYVFVDGDTVVGLHGFVQFCVIGLHVFPSKN